MYVIFAIFLLGFTAMSAQIVLLRQLIIVFYGNEVSLGFFLAAWLFWGALGSWLLGRFADKIRHRQFSFALLQVVLALSLAGTIFVVRNARAILGVFPGEIIGFLPAVSLSFVCFSLICIILGFLFALACRIYPVQANGSEQVARVYILEALGAVCGGCLVSLFFIRYFDALYILWGLAGLNLICAYLLLVSSSSGPRFIAVVRPITLALIVIILGLLFTQKAKLLKQASIRKQWSPFEVVTVQDSIYSNLVLTRGNDQYSLFSNGLYLFTVPDELSCEEAAHFALLQTPRPQRVLLIGGGIGGLAKEILKHPVSNLDYVELDPQIVDLARQFLPPGKLDFLKDRRLTIFHQDGRSFIKGKSRSPNSPYDCVITYLGDPYTAQINRFYTLEFFQEVKSCLAADGVFSFGLSSSENFINPEQQQFLASIHRTLGRVFKQVKVIPGDTAYFLAANKAGILTYDYNTLISRLKTRSVQAKYVRKYYLFAKMSADRIAYLEDRIKQESSLQVNSDFRPISYYYDMLLWSTYFAQGWRKIFSQVSGKLIWFYFSFVYIVIILFGFLNRKRDKAKSPMVLLAVSTTGLTELSFQVVILLSFQIIYGYLYYKLGIMLSSFMIGLVLGSWLIRKKLKQLFDDYRLFIKTQIAISIYPLILPFVFYALSAGAGSRWTAWLGSNIVFPALPIISGFVGGFQFPLANKIILKDNQAIGHISGLSYGMDLLGSCLGALLVSAVLVPILGITQTCLGIALLNTSVLATLCFFRSSPASE